MMAIAFLAARRLPLWVSIVLVALLELVPLLFIRDPSPKLQKLRLHIDVNATDCDQEAELARLVALGARHTDIGQGDVSWYVLTDPEGNEFCLLKERVEP